jgi:(p)ppGpp synthase/HD superfamily hydrolase
MGDLTAAIRLAADLHDGQVDKAGEPYILHPLRVMLAQTSNDARIVGVLHDVAEDCEFGWQDIHDCGFSEDIIVAVDSVTRRDGEDYFDYVQRAAANPIGRAVKQADLEDNLRNAPDDLERSGQRRRMKYSKALDILHDAAIRAGREG